MVALVGRRAAGSLDFHVRPDGQVLWVWMLEVYPGFQQRGLASVLMDALYAAYPTAWINHGTRTPGERLDRFVYEPPTWPRLPALRSIGVGA
ncbi:GNAT family N-acetyltransferase [Streptomyces sp. 2231.1]|uniref:GNAT family N-acetyltransferase n=1 Tax=Streptomyces sp. 2231.1 TaxID=1855347 RepID=UPI000D1BBA19